MLIFHLFLKTEIDTACPQRPAAVAVPRGVRRERPRQRRAAARARAARKRRRRRLRRGRLARRAGDAADARGGAE